MFVKTIHFIFETNRLFSVQPEKQSFFPAIAQVPSSQLMKNKDFYALSYSAFFSMNFLVSNIDDSALLSKQVAKSVYPAIFSAKPSVAAQLDVRFASFNIFIASSADQNHN